MYCPVATYAYTHCKSHSSLQPTSDRFFRLVQGKQVTQYWSFLLCYIGGETIPSRERTIQLPQKTAQSTTPIAIHFGTFPEISGVSDG